jgi:hypothetical protein
VVSLQRSIISENMESRIGRYLMNQIFLVLAGGHGEMIHENLRHSIERHSILRIISSVNMIRKASSSCEDYQLIQAILFLIL